LWSIVLSYVPLLGRLRVAGASWGFSNRETTPDAPPWVGRAERAYRNHLDNLPLFAIAVLVAHATSRHGGLAASGGILFGASRIVHSIVYVAGVTVVRTLAFWASLVGVGLIVSQLMA
jgi:uncharacterized MAPEG superfamily protein